MIRFDEALTRQRFISLPDRESGWLVTTARRNWDVPVVTTCPDGAKISVTAAPVTRFCRVKAVAS